MKIKFLNKYRSYVLTSKASWAARLSSPYTISPSDSLWSFDNATAASMAEKSTSFLGQQSLFNWSYEIYTKVPFELVLYCLSDA